MVVGCGGSGGGGALVLLFFRLMRLVEDGSEESLDSFLRLLNVASGTLSSLPLSLSLSFLLSCSFFVLLVFVWEVMNY